VALNLSGVGATGP